MKLVNTSLKQRVYAKSWKTTIIQPLLKKIGLELIYSNFRPMNNLPFIFKLVEHCMLYRLNEHCDQHSLLPTYQSSYRQFHSCETALLKMSNDLLWAIENKNCTAPVGIDLSVAFDMVNHYLLK